MPLDTKTATAVALPNTLAADLQNMGVEMLATQGRTMVLQRQPALDVLRDPTGVGAAAITAQQTSRKVGAYFLNDVLPKVIRLVGETDGVRNIVDALKFALSDVIDPAEISELLLAVAGKMDEFQKQATETSQAAALNARLASGSAAKLDGAIKAALDKLEGENGQMAAASAAIKDTDEQIMQAYNDVVTNAESIGDGVKDLVTYVLTVVVGNSGNDKKPAEGDADKDADTTATAKDTPSKTAEAGTDTKKSADTAGEINSFPAESIGTISKGIGGISEAVTALDNGNEKLVGLYQSLAAMSALVSAAQVINSQASGMSATSEKLSTATDQTAAVIGSLTGSFRQFAEQASNAEAGSDAQNVLFAEVNKTIKSWNNLGPQLKQMQSTFAGVGSFFPPRLDN